MRAEDQGREQKLPLQVGVLALEPVRGRSPWWSRSRLTRFRWSHIVLYVGGHVWSQPWKGVGRCVPLDEYIKEAGLSRPFVTVDLLIEDHDPDEWFAVAEAVAGRRSQRIRSALRYLRLWPRPAWNCTSPVRLLLNAVGIPVIGETPDDIIAELGCPRDRGPHQQGPDRTA